MARRDLLNEILRKRGRHSADATRLDLFCRRSEALRCAIMKLLEQGEPDSIEADVELSRYFPVALVACIEGYFRMAIANLIDKGSPFIDRVSDLRDINISVDVAVAIQTKKVTLGEYISHFLSISNLEDINRAISALLKIDFLETLLSSQFHLFEEDPPIQLDQARGDFILAVQELFQTRHMLCHEFASDMRVDNAGMLRFFTATDVLVSLAEVIIWAEESRV